MLGTAEKIVQMDVQVREVEADLSVLGRNCNSRLVERKGNNVGRLELERRGKGWSLSCPAQWPLKAQIYVLPVVPASVPVLRGIEWKLAGLSA